MDPGRIGCVEAIALVVVDVFTDGRRLEVFALAQSVRPMCFTVDNRSFSLEPFL